MSHHALQRALVIALHDPTFVAAFHADPAGVLGPLGLDPAERAQLVAADPRAFATDPLRRRRTLRVLAEEFKASTSLALAETRRASFAEGFFSSPFFRAAVAERGALAPAFGEYLAAAPLESPHLPDVIRLELGHARCRRDKDRPPRPGLALAPGVTVLALDAGVLETVQRVERWLFELGLMPQLALCVDSPPIPELPRLGEGTLHLLLAPSQADVSLSTIDEDLHRVLAAIAARPLARRAEAVAALTAVRVPAASAEELIQALLEEGLLSEGPAPGAPLLA